MTSECLPWGCPINGELTIAIIEAITGNIIFYEKQLYKDFQCSFYIEKKTAQTLGGSTSTGLWGQLELMREGGDTGGLLLNVVYAFMVIVDRGDIANWRY